MKKVSTCVLAVALVAAIAVGMESVGAQGAAAPSYTATGELILPSDFREWVFVGTSLGMTDGPATRKGPSVFENIYVTRDAYRAFMQSGTWPEKTMFVMEGRAADSHELLANTGQSAGDALFIEASVKDSTRYPDTTWAYFNYGDGKKPSASATPIPKTASCYACHDQNTAVEYSFAQFYPAVCEAAKRLGTVKPTYDPKKKFSSRGRAGQFVTRGARQSSSLAWRGVQLLNDDAPVATRLVGGMRAGSKPAPVRAASCRRKAVTAGA